MRTPNAVVLLAMIAFLGPTAARAQFQGAWLPERGTLSTQVYSAYSDNSTWFCGANLGHCAPGSRGNLSDTIESENARTTTLGIQASFAPRSWLVAAAALPFHFLRYDKNFGTGGVQRQENDGPGDLRLLLRSGFTRGPWALSGGYGLEIPTGDFAISASVAPVGQGTRNHDLFAEGGRSLWPFPGFLEAGVLVRLREPYTSPDGVIVDWGDEIHGRLKAGWNPSARWLIQVEAHVYRTGDRTSNVPGEPPGQFRSLLEIAPGVFYRLPWGAVEGWVKVPVAGRAVPADPSLGAALTGTFALLGRRPPVDAGVSAP